QREVHDLARRAVAHAQRLDLRAGHAELREQLAPRAEASRLGDELLRVAGERERAVLVEAAEQHAQLERRELLHLVDRDVPVGQRAALGAAERADAVLEGGQQERMYIGVERR